MPEESRFSFAKFYDSLAKGYNSLVPVDHELIGEKSSPNVMGTTLELVSVGRLLYFRMMQKLGLAYITRRSDHTNWDEHVETEKKTGLMTTIGEFDFTLAVTAAEQPQTKGSEDIKDKIREGISASLEIIGGRAQNNLSEANDRSFGIRDLQNMLVADLINNSLKGLDRGTEGERLAARVVTENVYDGQGRLVEVDPKVEFKGWPMTVWAVISDEQGKPYGFRPITFRKPTKIENPFALIDWNRVCTGSDVGFAPGSDPHSNIIEAGEIHYLDEWHEDKLPYRPDVVVGQDIPGSRLADLTHDRYPAMLVGIGKPKDRSGTIKLIMPTHRPYIGIDVVGSMPTEKDPRAPWSMIEATMANSEIAELIDNSEAAEPKNEAVLRAMGEYEMQVTPVKSLLRESLRSAGIPDFRQQKEDVLALSQLQDHPCMRAFAERVDFYKAHQSFMLPDVLNQAMVDVPKLELWRQRKLLGVTIPAFAAALTAERNMGIDVGLRRDKVLDMTLAPMGYEIFEEVKALLEDLEETEHKYGIELRTRLMAEYDQLNLKLVDTQDLSPQLKILRAYCESHGDRLRSSEDDYKGFWAVEGMSIVETLETEDQWFAANLWMEQVTEETAKQFETYAAAHGYESVIDRKSESALEKEIWWPIIEKCEGITAIIQEDVGDVRFQEAIEEDYGDRLTEDAISKVSERIAKIEQAWLENFPLPREALRSALAHCNLVWDENTGRWMGILTTKREARQQITQMRNWLMHESSRQYRRLAVNNSVEAAIAEYMKIAFAYTYKYRLSAETMDTLKALNEVAEGKRMGATDVNASLGPFRVLEPIAVKGGAAGVTSTLRFGGHYSRIISWAADSIRQRTGLKLLFSTAGAANGTTEAASQLNDKFDWKKILTEPRNVIKTMLPIIRSNHRILVSFMNYVDQLDKDEMGEADKALLLDTVAGSGDNEYGNYLESRNLPDRVVRPTEGSLRRQWQNRVGSRKMGHQLDARIRIADNVRAAAFFEAFEAFARAVEKGDHPDERARSWIKDFGDRGYRQILAVMMEKETAEFELNLAGVLLVFHNLAAKKSEARKDFRLVRQELRLRQARFAAADKVAAAEAKLNQQMKTIGDDYGA